jgi:glc operon protein GlcG
MYKQLVKAVWLTIPMVFFGSAVAQQPQGGAAEPTPKPIYGAPITLEQAKLVAAAAEAHALRLGVNAVISIVEISGEPVLFEKMTNSQYASITIADRKARTAARYRRPTEAFDAMLKAGSPFVQFLPDVMPGAGGVPLMAGVSGGNGSQDGEIAQAGADAVK